MSKFAYLFKKVMPRPVVQTVRLAKAATWQLFHPGIPAGIPLEDQFPWCSPDIWRKVVDFYISRPDPKIFEYGTGVSSLHHIQNLLKHGGSYIAVDHKSEWYVQVLNAIVRFSVTNGFNIDAKMDLLNMPLASAVATYNATFQVSGRGLAGCTVKLKLRPPNNRGSDADGTLAEFHEYVNALDEPCDVVVVDGRARKACVNHVLDNDFFKPGGLLVLFDAGRGIEGWLGSPALTGTSNYQPEVARMLALGGKLFDGSGLDSWPGLKQRRTTGRNALTYPAEACFLVKRTVA